MRQNPHISSVVSVVDDLQSIRSPYFQMETQSLTLFWDSEHEEDGAVAELLASTPHVDWTKPLFLFAVSSHLLQKASDDAMHLSLPVYFSPMVILSLIPCVLEG